MGGCAAGMVMVGSTCMPCGTNCNTCQTDQVTCLTCNTGFYLGANATCTACTGDGYLISGSNCIVCDSTCKTCTGTGTTQCTSCYGTNQLQLTNPGACAACGVGKYLQSSICQVCNSNCYTCAGTSTTCTGCDFANGWYLFNTVCIKKPSFATYQGVNTTANTVVNCTDTHCTNCQDDYTTCVQCDHSPHSFTSTLEAYVWFNPLLSAAYHTLRLMAFIVWGYCDTGTGWYLDGTVCKNTPLFATYQGINSALGTVANCTASNCINCLQNYSQCVTCNTTGGYYLNGLVCTNIVNFTATQGVNTTAGTVVSCLDANCINCKTDYTNCTACNTTANYWRNSTFCVAQTAFQTYEGIDSATGTVKFCNDTNCINCKANYMNCTACNTTANYWRNSTFCESQATFLPTEGADPVTGTVKFCNDTNCVNCKNDYMNCTACNTIANWYRNGTFCELQSTFATNEGADTTTGTVKFCADSNCLNCNANYSNCVTCNTAGSWYQFNSGCLNKAAFQTYQGVNTTSNAVVNCSDTNCVNCKNNYAVCTVCDTTNGYFLDGTVCKNRSQFATNQGINVAAGTVQLCTDTRCTNCTEDYTACVYCSPSTGWYRNGTRCVLNTTFMPNEGGRASDGTVQFCNDTHCTNCTVDYMQCARCDTTTGWYRLNTYCLTVNMIPAGLGINYNSGSIVNCLTSNCVNCSKNYTKCTGCDTDIGWYLLQNRCVNRSMMAPYQGIRASTGTVETCTDFNCINCIENYQLCVDCDPSKGYVVETSNGTCRENSTIINLKIVQGLVNKAAVDVSYGAVSLATLDPVRAYDFYKELQYHGTFTAKFLSKNNPTQVVSADVSIAVEAGAVSAVLNLKFNAYLPERDYLLYLRSEGKLDFNSADCGTLLPTAPRAAVQHDYTPLGD